MSPCLTLSIIRYRSRVKWSNPGNGVAPSPTPRCSSYWKGSLLVTLDCSCRLYLLIYIILLSFYTLRIFHTGCSWWSLTGVCVTASLLRSLWLFWLFKPILTMLWSGWSRFFLWFPIPLIFFPILWERNSKRTNYNWYPSHPYVFFLWFSGKFQVFMYLFAFFYFHLVVCRSDKNPQDDKFVFLFIYLFIYFIIF